MFLNSDRQQLATIIKLLTAIYTKENKILSALSDLQGAVANLNTQTTAELQAIAAKLAGFGDSVSSADVENAVAGINNVASQLAAETASLVGTSTGTATGTGTSS